ncbi:hypothetical protein V6N13_061393 [Hibiscus sabdariffa]
MLKLFPRKQTAFVCTKYPSNLCERASSSSSLPHHLKLTKDILNTQNPHQALKLFNSNANLLNPLKNLEPYSATIHVLTGAGLYADARCLIKFLIEALQSPSKPHRACHLIFNALNRLQTSKFTPNVFGSLIIAFSQMDLIEDALWVYRNIKTFPQMQACNALLHGLVKLGRFDSMWGLYKELLSRGFLPNVGTYGVLINCCCCQGDVLKARDLFYDLLMKGFPPNVVIYTTVIKFLCDEGKMLEAECMFRFMKERHFLPNLYTYNVLVNGYFKMNNVKRAFEVYRMMIGDGLGPNIVTFGILVDGHCKMGELIAARSYWVCMLKYGVLPNIFAYNCLIDGYCRGGNVSEAVELISEMEKLKILPDVFTYSILIKGLCSVGKVDEASFLLHKMKKGGVLANSVTYNSLIDGYCKLGNMEKALEICSQMTENGVAPNVITFSTLIDGYCKTGNMEAAMGVYSEMIIKGLFPDVVACTALINGYCKNGNIKEAFRSYKEMLEFGLMPNSFTLSSLIDGLCKDGRISEAFSFFMEKTRAGICRKETDEFDGLFCSPNHVMYTSLIQAMCKEGRVLEASKIFLDLRCCGLMVDGPLYIVMLEGHFQAKHMIDVMMLHADMIKMGIMPSIAINMVMARGYQEIGDLGSALRCSEDLAVQSLGILNQRDQKLIGVLQLHLLLLPVIIAEMFGTFAYRLLDELSWRSLWVEGIELLADHSLLVSPIDATPIAHFATDGGGWNVQLLRDIVP